MFNNLLNAEGDLARRHFTTVWDAAVSIQNLHMTAEPAQPCEAKVFETHI